ARQAAIQLLADRPHDVGVGGRDQLALEPQRVGVVFGPALRDGLLEQLWEQRVREFEQLVAAGRALGAGQEAARYFHDLDGAQFVRVEVHPDQTQLLGVGGLIDWFRDLDRFRLDDGIAPADGPEDTRA